MSTTTTINSVPTTALHPERLTGSRPQDANGQPCDPGDVRPIDPSLLAPTMLTKRELDYLHYLASEINDGRIVELGCFLGGSTRPLVIGRKNQHPRPPRILVYDSFVAPNVQAFEADPSLSDYGLTPDQDFLDLYRSLHAPYRDDLCIRQGFIPSSFNDRTANILYPEQEPIGLLFIDAAKSWGVHHTIAMTFYEHLIPGSIIVHQDIGDFRTPWLLIYMFQLREYFEPMDRVRGTPMISFRCTRTPTHFELAERLALTPDDFDSSTKSASWELLINDWSSVFGFHASEIWSGHRATHALHTGDPFSTIQHAEEYDRWMSVNSSIGHYISPDWSQWISKLPEYMQQINANEDERNRTDTIARVHRAYGQLDTPKTVSETWKTDAMKQAMWSRVEDRLVRESIESIVLFGAGRHTRWLLGSGWPKSSIEVKCIIDERPLTDSIAGIPVYTPNQLDPMTVSNGVLLPSSDAYEAHMIQRVGSLPQLSTFSIWKVYTDDQSEQIHHDSLVTDLADHSEVAIEYLELNIDRIEITPLHRVVLGLDSDRAWIHRLAESIRWPDWTKGHINEQDGAFLWDLIELVSMKHTEPFSLIELGTASGVSTSALAHGLDELAPTGCNIHAFDIMERCYFDSSRKVGDAVYELASDLLDDIHVHPGANARNACKCFGPASIPLVFIDADHRHPAPAIDLLALLPCLSPGAWVVLHDIELNLIQSIEADDPGSQSGPNKLYNDWPYTKIRPIHADPCDSNIGAIKLPELPFDPQSFLIDLIEAAES